MTVLTLRDISIGNPQKPLVDHASLTLAQGEHVCLVGRNGEGKSTLLRTIAGELMPDHGEVICPQGINVAYLPQTVPRDDTGSVFEVVSHGLSQNALHDEWEKTAQTQKILSLLGLNAQADFASLSGGLKRRVLLAKALVNEPDVLLLDEPTNHLDIDAIIWLEGFLARFRGALIIVSHDRAFVEKIATAIWSLDRGHLNVWPGGLTHYVRAKQAMLVSESRTRQEFGKQLAKEEAWLRQGVKARRARNEGRVRKLQAMRQAYSAFRSPLGSVALAANHAERSGKLVIDAEHVCFAYGADTIINDVSFCLTRGEKVGILGPNGCGKSTLIQLLLKQQVPDAGEVRHGTALKVAFFDQLQETLQLNETVIDNVIQGSEMLEIGGKTKHVMGYLNDFLFTPEKARAKVASLSGGEQKRVLLAKLLATPSNLLVLDEPTNDLDMESLEILEHFLVDYPGSVILVSHDRAFINNVVTCVLAYAGEGRFHASVGGYDDWQRHQAQSTEHATDAAAKSLSAKEATQATQTGLSFTEKHQLLALEADIERLETKIREQEAGMARADFYDQAPAVIRQAQQALADNQGALAQALETWEALLAKDQ